MKNLLLPQPFTTAATIHCHKPITRRIYYNNYVVMVTNCNECKEELSRWIISENGNEQLNINTYSASVTTDSSQYNNVSLV